ncbi:MAG: drug/metabolite transporter, family [Solirubrobacteraceae bacterium]|nr:drug/metabolite transporter, family [Solirubrobacteraceae bacterium]
MSGALAAAASGIGFGLFQSVNARVTRGVDPFASTLLQLAVAAVALVVASLATGGLGALADAPAWALLCFVGAAALHFSAGWTFLNMSQQRIGAARTSPLLTTVPVFGIGIAAVALGQLPDTAQLPAIAVMVLGAWVVASRGRGERPGRFTDVLPALMTALCWALSPALTVRGLKGLGDPLAGLAVGLVVSVVGYGVAVVLWRRELVLGSLEALRAADLALKVLAGVLVAGSTWGRWAALDGTTVAAVLALNLLSVPVVLLVAPAIAGRHAERVTPRVWLGAALIVAGSLLLVGVT